RPREDLAGRHACYRGRTGIYELVAIDEAMRRLVHEGASEAELERQARSRSASILEDGWRKCVAGNTSSEEVLRATRRSEASLAFRSRLSSIYDMPRPPTDADEIRINARLTGEDAQRFRELQRREGLSASDLLRDALREYHVSHTKPVRDAAAILGASGFL